MFLRAWAVYYGTKIGTMAVTGLCFQFKSKKSKFKSQNEPVENTGQSPLFTFAFLISPLNKKPAFFGGGFLYFDFSCYTKFPPPCITGIIITTTIIIEVIREMIILFLFNMKDVCSVNIHPPF